MSPDGTSHLRPENAAKLTDLQRSTGALASQLEMLAQAVEDLATLRKQAEHTNTQAELAVVTSLDATNEIANISPQVADLRRKSVTRQEMRHRALLFVVWGIVAVLLVTYGVVTGQQVFSKYCQYPMYLSQERTETCNSIFIGDRVYYPGDQFSNKNPGPAPAADVETNNG